MNRSWAGENLKEKASWEKEQEVQTLSSGNEQNCAKHSASASEQPVRRWNLGLRHMELTQVKHLSDLDSCECGVKMESSRYSFYLFIIYLWLHWVFIAACGLSLVTVSGGYSSCSGWASHCVGFFCCSPWT